MLLNTILYTENRELHRLLLINQVFKRGKQFFFQTQSVIKSTFDVNVVANVDASVDNDVDIVYAAENEPSQISIALKICFSADIDDVIGQLMYYECKLLTSHIILIFVYTDAP